MRSGNWASARLHSWLAGERCALESCDPSTRLALSLACASIRRTDRALTQFYDEILAPSGLYITQFTTLAEAAPITINHLAELLVMDRTTLTRDLELLTKQHLVRLEEGQDRRIRLVFLTQEGEQALRRAWPLWQEAQARIKRALGRQRFEGLLADLSSVLAAAS